MKEMKRNCNKRGNLSAPKSGKNLEKRRNNYFFVKAFSTPWFLLSTPTNHTLIYFLLEMLNNLIQYQFDGNSNLVYTIIRKRAVFHNLAHFPSDGGAISKFVDYLFIRKCTNPFCTSRNLNNFQTIEKYNFVIN